MICERLLKEREEKVREEYEEILNTKLAGMRLSLVPQKLTVRNALFPTHTSCHLNYFLYTGTIFFPRTREFQFTKGNEHLCSSLMALFSDLKT